MITLVTEKGTQRLSAEHWNDFIKRHPDTYPPGILSVVVSNSIFPYSLFIASPQQTEPGCLNNKIFITPEAIKQVFQYHRFFDPLRVELNCNMLACSKPIEIAILGYFYLNPLPFSTSLIARWFEDAGLEALRASELARVVYTARTNREESELWFIDDEFQNAWGSGSRDSESCQYRTPDNLNDVFSLLHKSSEIMFHFDSLCPNPQSEDNSIIHINMENVDECSFLVEDHLFIIAGMATSITEMAKLSESRWPAFQQIIMDSIPVFLRDFYSLGRLISEKPDILHSLRLENPGETDLISIGMDGKMISKSLDTWLSGNKCLFKKAEVPIYLRIRKQ
ncbi:MAG: hypothetical protein V1775_08075 [Bacteroidota bacterium]